MRVKTAILGFTGAAICLAGCAARYVAPHAKTIGAEISSFQADLSSFQDSLKLYQAAEHARIEGTGLRRDRAAAMSKRLQVEWEILNAATEGEAFAALQTQGRDELSRLTSAAPSAFRPAPTAFPLDKVAATAADLDKLSNSPGRQADMRFLLEYGAAVNKQLKQIEKSTTPGADAKTKVQ